MTVAGAVPPAKVKAVFLFNHRFEANLALLDRIYAPRFDKRHVIMPFATAPGAKLSRVYELGRNFSGHIAQSAREWIEHGVTHYAIIADDLLLNPALDQANLIERLQLAPNEAYTKNLISLDALRFAWPWAGEAAVTFARSAQAIDLRGLLPPENEAKARFEGLGIAFPPPAVLGARASVQTHRQIIGKARRAYFRAWSLGRRPAAYPLLAGYSDFLVVPASAIERFVAYCGVFAALNLFAEVAVPTALALAADRVRTELPLNTHFLDPVPASRNSGSLKGVEIWTAEDLARHAWVDDDNLERLLARFPADCLYVHPIKLSRYR